MECQRFSHLDENGDKVYVDKVKFDTHDEAVSMAKKVNARESTVNKLVTYKCGQCHKYHIGNNGKKITPSYRRKIKQEVRRRNPNGIRVVGKIDLSQFD